MRIREAWLIALSFALAMFASAFASAQSVEVWGGLSGMVIAPSGAVDSAYSPPMLFATDYTSSAGQILTLDGAGALGFQGGVNVFRSPRRAGCR